MTHELHRYDAARFYLGGDRTNRYRSDLRLTGPNGGHVFVTDTPATEPTGPLFPSAPAVHRCVNCQTITCDLRSTCTTTCTCRLRMLTMGDVA